ncbi:alkene reductase [Haloferula rosea]|uniref:Alkene reductase n=1 Tax=Haloferula rosea TaxID=490093 RepID=A0A934R7T7_9BACT|nr:alkene reductase [Haloferula rosea]MBK1825490.1 alkene reductase [Haloferula rosea]
MSSPLLEPTRIGSLDLRNRIIMAPLTRCRAVKGRVPTPLMAEYYAQRSNAGLILSEATSVTPRGVGYPNTPGIWSDEQVDGWKQVTDAVHAEGGLMMLQLWHVGRISHPTYLDGQLPVAPSAIAAGGHVSLIRPEVPFPTPHALTQEEIREAIADFRKGAENAKAAGFDGVQLHAANGYLIDQFLQDSTNKRDDEYGGSIENRCRFLMETLDAVLEVWEPGRVGVHLAPRGDAHDMGDSDPRSLFLQIAEKLRERGIAFISAREHHAEPPIGPEIKETFGGPFIANEQFDQAGAESAIRSGKADAVAFGQKYIANPDLVERFRLNAPLNEPKPESFYYLGKGDIREGYTDYPALDTAKA